MDLKMHVGHGVTGQTLTLMEIKDRVMIKEEQSWGGLDRYSC